MVDADNDTGNVTAYSCRSNLTSKAKNIGVSLNIIVALASWSKDKNFKRFYLKGDLRPKTYSFFYDVFLLISYRKSLVDNFVTVWSVYRKLWSDKVLNAT